MIWTNEEFIKLKRKDPTALKNFYNTYKGKVYNFLCLKIKGNEEVIEDIFGETFHSALINVVKLKHKKNISAWLTQIANNKLNDYLRKKYREKKYLSKIYEDDTDCIDHADELHKKEKIMQLKIAIKSIKPNYSEAIKMKYIEGMSFKDIAKKKGARERSVISLVFRAKQALKKELLKNAHFFEENN